MSQNLEVLALSRAGRFQELRVTWQGTHTQSCTLWEFTFFYILSGRDSFANELWDPKMKEV